MHNVLKENLENFIKVMQQFMKENDTNQAIKERLKKELELIPPSLEFLLGGAGVVVGAVGIGAGAEIFFGGTTAARMGIVASGFFWTGVGLGVIGLGALVYSSYGWTYKE